MSLVHFYFVLVSSEIPYPYILDISPLSAMWFANISPQVCSSSFLSLSSVFQRVNILNFDEVQFANFFLLWIMLRVSSAMHTLSLRTWRDESWLFRHQSLEERGPVYRKDHRETSRHLATRLAWKHNQGDGPTMCLAHNKRVSVGGAAPRAQQGPKGRAALCSSGRGAVDLPSRVDRKGNKWPECL